VKVKGYKLQIDLIQKLDLVVARYISDHDFFEVEISNANAYKGLDSAEYNRYMNVAGGFELQIYTV
jgi:hypothetical protein